MLTVCELMNTFNKVTFPKLSRCFFLFYNFAYRRKLLRHSSSLLHGRRLRMMQTALDILRPVADVLVRIKDQVHRAGHVMLALTLAHIVHRAIILVRMIRYMIVFLVAQHFVRCKIYFHDHFFQLFCYPILYRSFTSFTNF